MEINHTSYHIPTLDDTRILLEEGEQGVIRGCHEIKTINGVFNQKWRDETSYLLCLLIYTTGMRNSEIEKIRPCDIIKIKGCDFFDVSDVEGGRPLQVRRLGGSVPRFLSFLREQIV